MPYDITSRILAGFRLVTTMTRLFCIWSTGTNLTKPLTTCSVDMNALNNITLAAFCQQLAVAECRGLSISAMLTLVHMVSKGITIVAT